MAKVVLSLNNNQLTINIKTKLYPMKKQFILFLAIALPLVCLSQKTTNFYETLEKKGYTTKAWTFLPEIEAAAKELDICSQKKCMLTDPVKNKKSAIEEQVNLGFSWGTSQPSAVQKNMSQLEKRLLKSNRFPRKSLINSFKKYPGYTYNAMASRMKFYIKTMESIEDDE